MLKVAPEANNAYVCALDLPVLYLHVDSTGTGTVDSTQDLQIIV